MVLLTTLMLLLLTWTKFSDFCIFLFYRVLILVIITVLKIPIEVTVTMKYSPDNKDAMVKYEDLQALQRTSRWQV